MTIEITKKELDLLSDACLIAGAEALYRALKVLERKEVDDYDKRSKKAGEFLKLGQKLNNIAVEIEKGL